MKIFALTACMLFAAAESRRPSKPYSSASKPSSSSSSKPSGSSSSSSKPSGSSSSASKPSSSSSSKPSSSSSSNSKPSASSSSASKPSGSSSSKPSSTSNSKPSGSSSSSSKPSASVTKPTTSSGNKYSYKGVSSAMKTSGWSSKAKKASTAYLAYLTAKKKKPKKPKLWTGYGYEGDDEWQEYYPISSCFSCVSYNGDNMDCERPDDSYSISSVGQVSCPDASHYCGFTLGGYGETGDNVFLERGCFAKTLFDSAQCSIPNNVESKWSITEGFEIGAVNTHCDYCDSNNCNGWTLRALPDDQFAADDVVPDGGLPAAISTITLTLSLYLLR